MNTKSNPNLSEGARITLHLIFRNFCRLYENECIGKATKILSEDEQALLEQTLFQQRRIASQLPDIDKTSEKSKDWWAEVLHLIGAVKNIDISEEPTKTTGEQLLSILPKQTQSRLRNSVREKINNFDPEGFTFQRSLKSSVTKKNVKRLSDYFDGNLNEDKKIILTESRNNSSLPYAARIILNDLEKLELTNDKLKEEKSIKALCITYFALLNKLWTLEYKDHPDERVVFSGQMLEDTLLSAAGSALYKHEFDNLRKLNASKL